MKTVISIAGPAPAAPNRTPGRLSTARSALGLLRERSWLGTLAGVVVISVVFLFLGRWQYHRHEARTERNNLVNGNFGAAPAPLDHLLPNVRTDPGRPLPKGLEWRPASMTGQYLADDALLLRNRPHDEENGYDVVLPFRTTGGTVVYIDRGWIPAGTRSAAEPDAVPQPPTGTVAVVARLRPSEPSTTRRAPAGQANRIAVEDLGRALAPADARNVLNAYGLMVSETPPPGQPRPAVEEKPDPGLGINLAYAVQWVAFAITAYVLLGVALVREVRRRRGEEPRPVRLPWRRRERDEFDDEFHDG